MSTVSAFPGSVYSSQHESLTIVGGGLVGTLAGLYLARRGYPVDIYDRRADPRHTTTVREGRSINLALSDRGWRALEGIGIGEQIRPVAIPMYQRVMHDQQGRLTYQPYGKKNQAIYSVSRDGLNRVLLDLAEADERIHLHFNRKCQMVDLQNRQLVLRDTSTGQDQTHSFHRLFGVDGAYSAVRSAMQKTDRFDYSQQYLNYGYKELTIEAGENGAWPLEKNALHIWPRGQYMMIALPNLDGSFNCTLFFPYEGPQSFSTLQTGSQVRAFFAEIFPDALPLMPDLEEDFFRNPTSSLVTIRCFPWSVADEVLLLGDASHAIVPFYGQGMNAGFEDCSVLDDLLSQHPDDWQTVFTEFQRVRKPNTDAMADLAVYNFEEMRDRVADPRFLLRKKIESKISAQYPDQWVPLYTQVTFSHTPYADAWANGQQQEQIMQRLMPHIHSEADYDLPAVQAMVQQELASKES